jgi:hypothetical protein
MAAIPVTIIGTMTYTDVGVGGGPMPGGPPPVIWPGPGYPAHPIAPGGGPAHPIVIPPDAVAPGVPSHPIYLPPPEPAHPIVIPPDAIAPGVPAHPIVLPPPGSPEHPIVIPPDAISPGVPSHPIYLPGTPAHPIVLPPAEPANSFTVAVRNNATGEVKTMTFVPGDVPPPSFAPGPKSK